MNVLTKEIIRLNNVIDKLKSKKQNITALYYVGRRDALRNVLNQINVNKQHRKESL